MSIIEVHNDQGHKLIPVFLNPPDQPQGFSAGELGNSVIAEYAGDRQMLENIRLNVARDISQFQPALVHNTGYIAIVGQGPSLADNLDKLRADKEAGVPIMAVKGAHDYLVGQGIVPDAAVSMDSQTHTWKGFTAKQQGCCYLIASKCHSSYFEHLEDCQVVMWHAWGGDEINALYPKGAPLVGGGSTSGLRAISLAWLMGFRRHKLYGYDSCNSGDQMRVDGGKVQQWSMPLQAGIHAPMRMCDAQLASQAIEFQAMTFDIMEGLKIEVVGDGLIADIMAERKRLGAQDGWTN